MSVPLRTRLDNRRQAETVTIMVGGAPYNATVGFDAAWRPKEIFLCGAKSGSDMEAILSDHAVTTSLALQHGIPAAALAISVGRLPEDGRASVIGAALDLLAEYEAARAWPLGELSGEPDGAEPPTI